MQIIKITQSQAVGDNFTIEFDNGVKLKCFTENVAEFCLYTGMELDDETCVRLESAAAMSRTKRRAARIVSYRAVSEGELVRKLSEKGESVENARAAAKRLVDVGAVNDKSYAEDITRHYERMGYGAAKIKYELAKRKIPRELWDDALSTMRDDTEIIDRLLASRLRGTECDKMTLKKASDYLARRGFSWEEIKAAIRRAGEYDLSEDE